ncbi:hypothetical protein GGR54DRAFT_353347 [Hypoxylon sp. NC1633]|nr:hypothetical protein GGR54DRAFT_353347 [Hypoxylon sp. NC1633]
MPAKKRTAAEAIAITPNKEDSSRRRSNRISSSGRKSSYFVDDDSDDGDDIEVLPGSGSRPRKVAKTEAKSKSRVSKSKADSTDELQFEDDGNDDDGDAYEDDGDTVVDEPSDSFDENDSESEVAPPTRKRGRGRPPKPKEIAAVTKKSNAKPKAPAKSPAKAKVKIGAKVSSEGSEDDDDSDDEDEDENRITFIPAVKMRDTDGIDYEDNRVHKNTLLFLKDLKANNKRSWLKTYDDEYRRSLKDWSSFVETLTEKIMEADDTIPELPTRDVVFRIYRDIRFSKDPTPYKAHYSAAWSRTGRKGPYACYYVHLEPGHCMVGGGLWHPEAAALARLRASVDERPHRIRRVLMNPAFRTTFLPAAKTGSEKAVIAAFAAANKENALKTKPKGFHPDHRDIELLKLRNYTIGKRLDDKDLTAENAQERIMGIIGPMVEFVTFLNSVVMPDPNLDSDSDEAEGNEGDVGAEGADGDDGDDDA